MSGTRGFWPMRDLPMVGWLVAAVVVALAHPFVPAPRWLMIHLLVLGAAGHAILVWSRYFSDTLLRCPHTPRGEQTARLSLFNLGVLAATVGVPSGVWPLSVVGATGIVLAVGWHGVVLARQLRGSLGSRFAGSVRYYVAAAALLPVGVGLGAWLARELPSPLHEQVRAAHVAINVFGWIGLTVLGTLVTLWPTMLRTRIDVGAERAARRALPVLFLGVVSMAATALLGVRIGYAAGLLCYLAGIGVLALPLVRTMRTKRPESFPAASVLAGLIWLTGSLVTLVLTVATADSWIAVDDRIAAITPLLAVGFAAQVLLGASSYLVPVVLGGGPARVRAANAVLDLGSEWRLVVTNAGLLVCALPVPSLVRVLTSGAVLVALASFVPLLLLAIRASRRAATATTTAPTPAPSPAERGPGRRETAPTEQRAGPRHGLMASGLATVLVVVALGVALDRAPFGESSAPADAGIAATGETIRVDVVADGMRFTPSVVTVQAGGRLVITLHNESSGDVHDLVLETGAETGRLSPGESATLDVGVVGRDLGGWCSILGHRQMGMVLAIDVAGAPVSGDPLAADPAPGEEPAGQSEGQSEGDQGATPAPGGVPEEGFTASDATLPPLPPRNRPGPTDAKLSVTHRYTFEVTETEQEVAPGVRQTMWTYNGTAPGPVLHGRVGDRFVITLVNDGTMGHSLDFHAGALAPDRPMRTIEPGGSLVYRFTSTRAGIWMYHCSTMPMSVHIAAGLFGAVIIEPRDLPPVDRSYVLVQSELYLGAQGGQVDVDALQAEQPDAVVFNGYANQYDHDPLRARVGERVRFWVLSAGPNRGMSFHVVGGQFDRLWREGGWLLGDAAAPARDSGAQVLSLAVAEGGFVDLTFPEAGMYPFINHVMVDAERGAHGVVRVRR